MIRGFLKITFLIACFVSSLTSNISAQTTSEVVEVVLEITDLVRHPVAKNIYPEGNLEGAITTFKCSEQNPIKMTEVVAKFSPDEANTHYVFVQPDDPTAHAHYIHYLFTEGRSHTPIQVMNLDLEFKGIDLKPEYGHSDIKAIYWACTHANDMYASLKNDGLW